MARFSSVVKPIELEVLGPGLSSSVLGLMTGMCPLGSVKVASTISYSRTCAYSEDSLSAVVMLVRMSLALLRSLTASLQLGCAAFSGSSMICIARK